MPDDKEKKYCVTIKVPKIDIIIIMPINEEHFNLITIQKQISWIFNPGCQLTIDKNFLDDFSIELVQ